jgi:tetratricopeptide (TPR) repeat protein
MKLMWGPKRACFLAVSLFLAACSSNPDKDLANGDKSFSAARYDEALIYYRNAIQINPKLAQGHYQLAQCYLRLNRFQEAFGELQKTVDLDPGNTEAQLQFAKLLINGKKYDDAKAVAEKVLATDPKNSRAYSILGDRLALAGDQAGAIRDYQTAIRLDSRRLEGYFALGVLYRSLGQIAESEAAFKQAVEANPQSETARLSLGRFYISQKNFAQAEAELRPAAKLAPHDPRPLLMLADADLAQGNRAEAEQICVQVKAAAPDDPEAYRALAMFYRSTKQPEKTLAELQSLRASKPKDSWVKASLGETLLELNRVKEASAPIEDLLSADANDPRALELQGRTLLSEHKYPEARAALEKSVKGDAKSATAWYYLGIAQQSSGQADSAAVSLAKAHELSPGTMGPRLALAELDANLGRYEEAESLARANPDMPQAEVVGARAELAKGNLKKAEQMVQAELNRDPSSLPALDVLVRVYFQDHKIPEATRRISELVSRYPQNAGLQLLMARVFFQAKDFAKAQAAIRRALALDPRIQDAHTLLAEIDAVQGFTDNAVKEFQAEIESHPYRDANYLALAGVYKSQGKWQEARDTLEKARALGSGSPYVDNNLAYLYLEHGGDKNVALSLAQKARRSLPDSPVAADTLGWAFYKSGAYDAAITQCSLSTQKSPDDAEFQYHLGMAYVGANRFDLAERCLRRALKSDPGFADAGSARSELEKLAKRPRK